jgi:hypothetical protein
VILVGNLIDEIVIDAEVERPTGGVSLNGIEVALVDVGLGSSADWNRGKGTGDRGALSRSPDRENGSASD